MLEINNTIWLIRFIMPLDNDNENTRISFCFDLKKFYLTELSINYKKY